jgi:hypothetical protein
MGSPPYQIPTPSGVCQLVYSTCQLVKQVLVLIVDGITLDGFHRSLDFLVESFPSDACHVGSESSATAKAVLVTFLTDLATSCTHWVVSGCWHLKPPLWVLGDSSQHQFCDSSTYARRHNLPRGKVYVSRLCSETCSVHGIRDAWRKTSRLPC